VIIVDALAPENLEPGRRLRVLVEEPLGGVVGVGFGEAVGVLLGGDSLPALQIEGDFD